MKTVIQVVLIIAIIVLGYLCYDSINQPIRFQKERDLRSEIVIQKLKDIRTAEVAFKSINEKFCSDFDSLINFVKHDSLFLVKKEGSLSDSLLSEGWNESMGIKAGMLKRDTLLISVRDSLFGEDYPIDSLKFVPFTNGEQFELGADQVITGSGVSVEVFEAKIHNDIYLKGLDRQEIINMNDMARKLERYPGLKVGSLTQTNNNAGNWE